MDMDIKDATVLVDNLLAYTKELASTRNHHIVAYSGGVDSSLVVALLQQVCSTTTNNNSNNNDDNTVHAVLGISPAVSQEQVEQARRVAFHLQVDLREVMTTEGSDSMYIQNSGQACYACKTHLYSSLQAIIHDYYATCCSNEQQQHQQQLYNGTNADDGLDVTRVGLLAASNFNVKSPLQHISKLQVRRAALHLGLPNWNAAAAPCLRSRLALGVQATRVHLEMIEQAERHVRNSILKMVDETANIRVRMLTNQRAMIEVDDDLLKFVKLGTEQVTFFRNLGFSSVSARPFRTGSVARREPEESMAAVVG
jgi:uncharacterized protein (TIGR00268 family)